MTQTDQRSDGNAAIDLLRSRLLELNREPFLDILANMMQCQPTPEALQRFANKYPDRWAQSLASMARIGGFADKSERTTSHYAQIAILGDADLLDQLEDVRGKLALMEQVGPQEKPEAPKLPALPAPKPPGEN